MKYLLVQAYFIVVIIISIFWSVKIIIFSLILKLGLPPIHLWFIQFSSVLNSSLFMFLVTLHKLFPLFLLGKNLFYGGIILISIILILRRLLLFQSNMFFLLLICSSIMHRAWIIFGFLLSKAFALTYWVLYRLLMIVILQSLMFWKLSNLVLGQNALSIFTWLIISGIPPFSLFFLKINLFLAVIAFIRRYWGYVLILCSVLALRVYFIAFHVRILQYSYIQNYWFIPILRFISIMRVL